MSWLSGLFKKLDIGDLLAKYLISKEKLKEMKRARVGDEVELPPVRTELLGGYWEIPLGPARKLEE